MKNTRSGLPILRLFHSNQAKSNCIFIVGDDAENLSQLFAQEDTTHPFAKIYQIVHIEQQYSFKAISSIYHNVITLSLDLSHPTALYKLLQYIENIKHHIEMCVFLPCFSNKTDTIEASIKQQNFQWKKTGLTTTLIAQHVIQQMLNNQKGSLIFLDASHTEEKYDHLLSQSLSAAKRALSQSLAREFQPTGIHICYSTLEEWDHSNIQQIESIKNICLHLHHQPLSTWNYEL